MIRDYCFVFCYEISDENLNFKFMIHGEYVVCVRVSLSTSVVSTGVFKSVLLLKVERLQNTVSLAISAKSVRDLHVDFKIAYVYDLIPKVMQSASWSHTKSSQSRCSQNRTRRSLTEGGNIQCWQPEGFKFYVRAQWRNIHTLTYGIIK
jgi:hypothetical protein